MDAEQSRMQQSGVCPRCEAVERGNKGVKDSKGIRWDVSGMMKRAYQSLCLGQLVNLLPRGLEIEIKRDLAGLSKNLLLRSIGSSIPVGRTDSVSDSDCDTQPTF
jgi:hypothetical protein